MPSVLILWLVVKPLDRIVILNSFSEILSASVFWRYFKPDAPVMPFRSFFVPSLSQSKYTLSSCLTSSLSGGKIKTSLV